jgi:hypothetical protein
MRNSFREALAFWHGMKNVIGQKARITGQTLNMFNHQMSWDSLNTDLLEKYADKSILNTSKRQGGAFEIMAKMVNDADNIRQLEGTLESALEKSGLSDIFIEHYMGMGLLSGISTNWANLIGGTSVMLGVQPTEIYFKNLWSRAMGHQYKDQAFTEYMAGLTGFVDGFRDSLAVAAKTIWHDKPVGFGATKLENFHNPKVNALKLGVEDATESRVSIFNSLGRVNRGGAPFLLAGDDFVRTSIHRMNTARSAYRQSLEEGLSGIDMVRRQEFLKENPQFLKNYNEVRLKSTELGDEATFTEELGAIGQGVQHLVKHVPITRIFTPFVKVLWNISDFALKRDPVSNIARGIVSSKFRDKVLANPEARAEFLSRMTTGVGLMSVGVWHALQGNITGTEETNYRLEQNKNMINHKPTSMRFTLEDGSIVNVDYSRLEPISKYMQWSADIVKILGSIGEEDTSELVFQLAYAIQDNLISDTWIPGIAEMTRLMTLGAGSRFKDKEQAQAAIERSILKMTSGMTPSFLREIERFTNNKLSESKGGELNISDDKFSKYGGALRGQQNIDKLIAKMKSTLPGYSDDSVDKLDRWGNVMLRNGDRTDLSPLEYTMPFTVYRKKYDKIDERMDALEMEIGDPSQNITVSDYSESPVRLKNKQYEQLILLSTKDLSKITSFLMNNLGKKIPPSMIDDLKNQPEYDKGSIKSEVRNLMGYLDKLNIPYSGKEGYGELVKEVFNRRRKDAREMLLWTVGNGDLIKEAKRRSDIMRQEKTTVF